MLTAEPIRIVGMEPASADLIRQSVARGRGGVVIDAADTTLTDWGDVERILTEAFAALREAKQRNVNLVAIVRADDEFGRRGPLPAMVACSLTSAVRSLALEARDLGMMANVVAHDGQDRADVVDAVCGLLTSTAITGQVIVLGRGHLGRLPL